jgi:hypothetical protein
VISKTLPDCSWTVRKLVSVDPNERLFGSLVDALVAPGDFDDDGAAAAAIDASHGVTTGRRIPTVG